MFMKFDRLIVFINIKNKLLLNFVLFNFFFFLFLFILFQKKKK